MIWKSASRIEDWEDTKRAEADAAYEIQKQTSRKTVEIREQEADIARREKEIELQTKEAEVAEKKLDAEIRKKAEADKYAEMQNADAELYRRQKDAEAQQYEAEKEAAAIRAKGLAEAEASGKKVWLKQKALDKKAEAMKNTDRQQFWNDRRSSSGYCKKCGRTIICD